MNDTFPARYKLFFWPLLLSLLGLLGLLPAVQAQEAVLSPEAIVVNPLPSFETEVFLDKDPSGTSRPNYTVGEAVRVGVRVSEDAYVYLFNVRSDGSIDQILPNNYDTNGQNNFVRGGETKYFPPEGANYTFRIEAPGGLDKVIALASQTPLDTSTLASFENDPNFASSNLGEQAFAEGLSVIVRPLPQDDWVTDTVLFYVGGAPEAPTQTAPPEQTQFGTLSVTSDPSGARVFIDGVFVGTTPLQNGTLSGTHRVRVEAEGYTPFETDIDVVGGETRGVQTTLQQVSQPTQALGQAGFSSTPSGADIYVDGQLVGTTPITNVRLEAGMHQVRFVLEGVGEDTVDFEVRSGGYKNVSGVLRAQQGTLELTGNVGGATVLIDGSRVGTIPNGTGRLTLENLSPGTHEITVTAPGFTTFVGEFEILSGQATSLSVSQTGR